MVGGRWSEKNRRSTIGSLGIRTSDLVLLRPPTTGHLLVLLLPPSPMKNLAILISGRGSNMESLIKATRDGRIRNAQPALVISNIADAPGLKIASQLGVETLVLDHRGKKREEHDQLMTAELDSRNIDLICLAGYMRLLSTWFTQKHENRTLNIHPSLLPAFPGLEAQRQAIDHGVKFSGCTVHLVDEHLDHGPIVAQSVVPVFASDTPESLASRILVEEHRIYPEAVDFLLNTSFRVVGRRVQAIDG